MDLILLDWTRMGKAYCLAGVTKQNNQYCVVRPLEVRAAQERKRGWTPWQMDGHSRWEICEMVNPRPATPEPPHLEDVLVRDLKPRRVLASPAERQAILNATLTPPGQLIFGQPLQTTPRGAWLTPGTGTRSLAGVAVSAGSIAFSCETKQGREQPTYRVSFEPPDLGRLNLPVTDHFLLQRAEAAGDNPRVRLAALTSIVQWMGDPVVIRLGLSPYRGDSSPGPECCWLMANGFFSLTDPQS